MAQINSSHHAPVYHSQRGYSALHLTHPHTAPLPAPGESQQPSAGARRRMAKAAVRERRREVSQGAGFLQRLTSTGVAEGLGSPQGARAPSRWRPAGAPR